MAVKILRNGKWPPVEPPKQVTCGHCTSELEYTSDDVERAAYYENGSLYPWILCPFCQRRVRLK